MGYEEIASFANGKDHATYQMALQILSNEIEHKQDIEDFLIDINRMKDDIRKLRL